MTRPRVADDFAAIRARMDELRRERDQAMRTEPEDTLLKARVRRVPIEEITRQAQLQVRRLLQ
jgi:hypothetical protein